MADKPMTEGNVLEVWEAKVDGWSWRHQQVLVLTERLHTIATIAWHRLVEVVGRKDVVERLGIEA